MLGVRSVLTSTRAADGETPATTPAEQPRHAAAYLSAVGLTLTNPMTIMAFGAVFASAGLVAQPGVASAATATVGIASGSLAWWLALVTGVSAAGATAERKLVAGISRISGAVIAAFGVAGDRLGGVESDALS